MAREPHRRDRDERDSEFTDKLVHINRVAKVVKGGRRFGFAALVVVGDEKGRVGFGHGKAREVPEAIRKATDAAKRGLIRVPLREGRTLHHDVAGRHGAGKVYLRAAPAGTGIIAGGPMRAVFETSGNAGRGGEIAGLVQSIQHGARDIRRTQASGTRRVPWPRAGISRYRRCSRAGASRARASRPPTEPRQARREADMSKTDKSIKIEQTGSPIRRHHTQRETLIGLGLNRIGRVAQVPDTPQTRGMIAKVRHLVRVVDAKGERQ